jgi:hypothetical protein
VLVVDVDDEDGWMLLRYRKSVMDVGVRRWEVWKIYTSGDCAITASDQSAGKQHSQGSESTEHRAEMLTFDLACFALGASRWKARVTN